MTTRTVLVTRPAPDAAPFARRLQAMGHAAIVEPLLEIEFLDDAALDLSGVAALAFTSANGVRAAVHADAAVTRLPAFCVGQATARAARDAGFANIGVAAGDVDDLTREITAARPPGTVLHVAGRDRAGDLVSALADAGIEAGRAVLYAARPREAFSEATRAALAEGRIDDVVIFSPRTARQFVTLVKDTDLEQAVARVRLLALSPRVAAAAALDFAAVDVAARPDQDALLDLIGSAHARDTEMADKEEKKDPARPDDPEPVPPSRDAAADVPPIPPPMSEKTSPARSGSGARRGGGLAFVLGIVLAFVLIGAAVALVAYEPRVNAEARRLLGISNDDASAVTAARIDALENAVKSLPPGVDPARLDTLDERLTALASRLDRLSGNTDVPRALVLLTLERRLETGRPFAALFDRVRPVLGAAGAATEDLDALAPYAERGVPTAPRLAAAVRALPAPGTEKPAPAQAAADSDGDADSSGGLWDRIKARLAGLVTVRRIGDDAPAGAPADPDPRARAAAAFAAGDVAAGLAALQEIDTAALPPDARAAYDRVLADARARQTADKLAAAIDTALAASSP